MRAAWSAHDRCKRACQAGENGLKGPAFVQGVGGMAPRRPSKSTVASSGLAITRGWWEIYFFSCLSRREDSPSDWKAFELLHGYENHPRRGLQLAGHALLAGIEQQGGAWGDCEKKVACYETRYGVESWRGSGSHLHHRRSTSPSAAVPAAASSAGPKPTRAPTRGYLGSLFPLLPPLRTARALPSGRTSLVGPWAGRCFCQPAPPRESMGQVLQTRELWYPGPEGRAPRLPRWPLRCTESTHLACCAPRAWRLCWPSLPVLSYSLTRNSLLAQKRRQTFSMVRSSASKLISYLIQPPLFRGRLTNRRVRY